MNAWAFGAAREDMPKNAEADTEKHMAKNAQQEVERQRLDLQLDRELEATFPASDALKITRGQASAPERGSSRKAKSAD